MAIDIAYSWKPKKEFGKKYAGVIVQGMGGSGIGAAIARDYLLEKGPIPVIANHDYSMPKFAGKNWLAVIVSYSGNTEETLAAFSEAKRRKMDIVCISSGGMLAKKCGNCILIPGGKPPRTQMGMTFVPVMAVLEKAGIASELANLKRAAAFLAGHVSEAEEEGKRIAPKLKGKIPVVYAGRDFASAAERFHTQLNENSKAFSHWNYLPELNHNELVGYKPLEGKLAFVFLREKNEGAKEKKRAEFTKKIAGEKSSVLEVRAKGKSFPEKMFYFTMAGDFASYYLALLNGVDPSSTKNIEKLKRELKK